MERTKLILGHLNNGMRTADITTSLTAAASRPHSLPTLGVSDDDVVIVSALRTPICKAKRGGFKDTLPDDLLAVVFQAVIKDAGIKPTDIQDICVAM